MREAFGAFQEKWRRDTAGKFPSSFDYFCAIYAEGAAFAARECGREARRLMVGPMEREQFATADALANAIRTAFPEAFK